MKKSLLIVILFAALLAIVAACSSKTTPNVSNGTAIKTVPVDSLTATLSSSTGQLRQGDQEVMLAFTDSSNKPVDVGAVSLNFHMPAMGAMAAMNDAVTFTTTATPGVYRGKVNIGMAGEWQGQLAYEGPAGKGKTTFSVTAR
jgi:YtkA-like